MIQVYSPPDYPRIIGPDNIFLAGSIEMGKARNWQEEFISAMRPYSGFRNWVVLNPRRKNWDLTWEQDISSPYFNQQVNWELDYLERANHRVFYFVADTLSPVTLMELGKFGASNSYVIYENNYLRKGNVQIFCHRYRIPIYPDIHAVINKIINI